LLAHAVGVRWSDHKLKALEPHDAMALAHDALTAA
jgi:hypothetical protein